MADKLLAGWGRYRPAKYPVFPADRAGGASGARPSLPRGLGRSYGDASLPADGHASADALALDKFISFDPAKAELKAEGGVSLQTVLEVFVPQGFFPSVTPGTKHVTLGGMAASNVHGKNHHHCGSIEHFISSLDVETAGGLVTCSRESHPDLFFATVGGYGLTGLIRSLTMTLKPIESSLIFTRSIRSRNLQHLFDLFREHDKGFEYSVAWVDALARGQSMGRGILMLGRTATKTEAKGVLAASTKRKVRVPLDFPVFMLNPLFMRIFNGSYYMAGTAGSSKIIDKVRDYEPYFYPLDAILDWNRVYGRPGFFQHQFVIPDPRGEEGMEECLRFLSSKGLGSFLTVLKRCGDDTVALPFCKTGYTLALDIPYRSPATLKALDELDELVLKYNGRVYLTKDARMRPEAFRAMYPEHEAWMAVVKKWNPDRRFNSRLAERLQLWGT